MAGAANLLLRVLVTAAATLPVAVATPVLAQRADDNALTAAEDAFGSSVGNESVGLYSPGSVRGFSPTQAGNIRIEGVYFDRQGFLSSRFTEGSAIRVGLSAQSYPFPAPTGIVDYRLQKAGEDRVTSLVAGLNAYAAPFMELDLKTPILGERLGLAAGVSYGHEEYYDGADARYLRAALVARWRPRDGVEVMAFAAITQGRDEETAPTIVTAGDFLPPEVARRRYFGQDWTTRDTLSENYGLIGKVRLGDNWSLTGGVFSSAFTSGNSFADLFVGTTPDGRTRERLIADPERRAASTSGELRLSRSFVEGPRLHVLHATVRARDVEALYGGSAPAMDLGERQLGERVPVDRPASWAFGERTRDTVRQVTSGLAYEGRWRSVGELSLGVQKVDYEKTVFQPGLPATSSADAPWLGYAAAAIHLSPAVALYAGYVEGLEESGIAPDNAANRNEALPAIRTRQVDAGVRWRINERWRLVAGGFQVQKPYFITNDANVFTILGDVQHRGVELSLTGHPTEALTVVAGAILLDPTVTGEAVEQGRIGARPVGQADLTVRLNLDYRLPFAPGWSVDSAVVHVSERTASRNGQLEAPGYTVIDLGARYRFQIEGRRATLRGQIANVTDEYYFTVFGSRSFGLSDGRRALLSLAVDF
ncbi:TonB-dependent receptor domain-containing protein [Brevundimonas sp.]|uniref:TonB-dependent receptor domain-containing protein n=1 Tax=Brevundimonas sp. TaxID=1871086 RepID=UPI002D61617A|nr:TonB-dependent receptor [Brevundimonas sp.]HYC99376.1 TonB-dependent receptor [Brevundimonas sp.]